MQLTNAYTFADQIAKRSKCIYRAKVLRQQLYTPHASVASFYIFQVVVISRQWTLNSLKSTRPSAACSCLRPPPARYQQRQAVDKWGHELSGRLVVVGLPVEQDSICYEEYGLVLNRFFHIIPHADRSPHV
jgi:hypothetical protein